MTTLVVNFYRHSGTIDDVYIGRAGRGLDGYFGNPVMKGFACRVCGETHTDSGSTLVCYSVYLQNRLATDPVFRARVAELKGRTLVCFCKPKPCHGDILAAAAESL